MQRSFGSNNVIHVESLQNSLSQSITSNLLLLHASTGCDATASFFNKSKKSALNVFQKNKELERILQVFYDTSADRENLYKAGLSFVLKLYSAPEGYHQRKWPYDSI